MARIPLVVLMVLLVHAATTVCAAEPIVVDLWPGEIPGPPAKVVGAERDLAKPDDKLIAGKPVMKLGHISKPQMHVFLPAAEKATGSAVMICPGGGFSILAWDLEGVEVARWLNQQGVAGIILKYRTPTRENGPQGKWEGPVMDAQRALSMARNRAAEWRLDVERIGVMGFSAGGETAARAACLLDKRLYQPVDAADNTSCAANFAMLIYAGGLVDGDQLRPDITVSAKTPPMFFVHAFDDRVSVQNPLLLASAMKKVGVPAELHIFPRGGHGYGMRATEDPVTHWPNRASKWLRDSGYLTTPTARQPAGTPATGNPSDHLPSNIRRLTEFGERPEFSHDGTKIAFLSNQFGDLMEYDYATGRISCLSQHFKHHGFNRVMYLANGDLLLTGPDETFDTTDKQARLKARHNAKLFVLARDLKSPPVPLGVVAVEGPAVSRSRMKVAWTHHVPGQTRQTAISVGEIAYEAGKPVLKNARQVLSAADFPEGKRPKMIETQNFVGPDDRSITVSAYLIENGHNTDGHLFDLESRLLTNFTNTPDHYEEVEGIFPDGKSTLVEYNTSVGKPWPMVDAWRVWFDGSRPPQRLTRFLDFPGFKASNYAVSDDGRLMAFQLGIAGDEAGVGYGIFVADLTKTEPSN